ncbi:hypothetical protein [Thermospira aquatica]|uniref:Uncharacterized protein n=1 Tax=Thermospira aquatica TaxID=2828656 RepID=A0AAX3BEI0_9SPIR|nr:hypothetical protein [Thermospira aquatica]URA10525.1 hypothetical protein KDW03_01605 [Thermospira aquatica]
MNKDIKVLNQDFENFSQVLEEILYGQKRAEKESLGQIFQAKNYAKKLADELDELYSKELEEK